jgi:hypothetical protein
VFDFESCSEIPNRYFISARSAGSDKEHPKKKSWCFSLPQGLIPQHRFLSHILMTFSFSRPILFGFLGRGRSPTPTPRMQFFSFSYLPAETALSAGRV